MWPSALHGRMHGSVCAKLNWWRSGVDIRWITCDCLQQHTCICRYVHTGVAYLFFVYSLFTITYVYIYIYTYIYICTYGWWLSRVNDRRNAVCNYVSVYVGGWVGWATATMTYVSIYLHTLACECNDMCEPSRGRPSQPEGFPSQPQGRLLQP